MAKDLFATATKVTKAKTTPKKEKEIVDLDTIIIEKDNKKEKKYPNAAQLLLDYQKYHAQAAEAKAMLETLGAQIRDIGKDIFIEKYQELRDRPESFIMRASRILKSGNEEKTETGQLMFISVDSYKKLDAIAAMVLEARYNCIERNTTYVFDKEMVEKHGNAISQAINNSKLIPKEDKEKIVKAIEEPCIKKGTIENINLIASITGKPEKTPVYGDDLKEGQEPVYDKFKDVAELIEKVEPTFQLKNI